MSRWKQMVLGDMGYTYGGLTNKTIVDFGFGKPFIPYMNIFSNGKINPKYLVLVNIHPGERQNTVKYGDLFFTTSSETVEEVGMTSVLLDDIGEAYLNSFCFGFRLNNFDDLLPEFAPFLFRGLELRKKISLFGQGSTRYNLPKTELLAKLKIDLPTIPEQRKIAKILSTADTVIEKTQAAIAKYKAIKQGMLIDLFTRGIDIKTGKLRPKQEDAPELYKQSELGWIPKEWDINEIGKVSSIVTNGFVGIATPYYTNSDNGVPYLFGTNIREDFIDFNNLRFISYDFHKSHAKSQLRPGDMLCVQSGHIGTCAIVPENFVEANCHALIITRFNKETIFSDFISYYLNSEIGKHELDKIIVGSTIKHINTSDLSKHVIPIPIIDEQNAIAKRLRIITNQIKSEQTYLQKLQRIKSGLMADLLSGNKLVSIPKEMETQTT
jgi:type I restriction enzyme S subunit